MYSSIITTAQAAKLLGVSPRTAQLWIESGEIPSWKTPGGHRRVFLSDVLSLLACVDPGQPAPPVVCVLADERRHAMWTGALKRLRVGSIACFDDPIAAAVAMGAAVPEVLLVHAETADDLRPAFLTSLRAVRLLDRLRIVVATHLSPEVVHKLLVPALACETVQLDESTVDLAPNLGGLSCFR
ncbi:helix-turn-helix domain-containing protein [Massilia sp. METH4]|uniref:MerR family transcriptional regulator n=1 Tax=Massilia sp. METH4 TaxID=3123041 RepID=UPI0030CA6633